MNVSPTGLEGLFLVEPRRFGDARGFFLESYQRARYRAAGMDAELVQDNHSRSLQGALRGMHFQVKRPQAQIVTVMHGRVFDVAVDLRPRSATFGKWFGAELSADAGPCQLYMAPGFAHGFYVLSEVADLHYKVSRYYDQADEGGVVWNDPDIGIGWPTAVAHRVSIAPRDAAFPQIKALTADLLPHEPAEELRARAP
jgi:dTDP-4-dehydrorhamnose 3,5-epimerase